MKTLLRYSWLVLGGASTLVLVALVLSLPASVPLTARPRNVSDVTPTVSSGTPAAAATMTYLPLLMQARTVELPPNTVAWISVPDGRAWAISGYLRPDDIQAGNLCISQFWLSDGATWSEGPRPRSAWCENVTMQIEPSGALLVSGVEYIKDFNRLGTHVDCSDITDEWDGHEWNYVHYVTVPCPHPP